MPDIIPSITESKALEIVRGFFLGFVSCEVNQALDNLVSMPTGEFIALTPILLNQLSTPVTTNTDTELKVKQSYQFHVQVDCYGERSFGRASSLVTLLRSSVSSEHFDSSGFEIQTLYAEDAKRLPTIDDQEAYIERWTFKSVLQLNQEFNLSTQTANTLDIDVISVDANYPA